MAQDDEYLREMRAETAKEMVEAMEAAVKDVAKRHGKDPGLAGVFVHAFVESIDAFIDTNPGVAMAIYAEIRERFEGERISEEEGANILRAYLRRRKSEKRA